MRAPGYTAFLVGLLVLLVPLPFFSELLNANNSSRSLLTQAMVESGTTRIDDHYFLTGDKAYHEGHYYSDKAPGMAMMAVPAYALALTLAGGPEALDFAPAPGEAAENHVPRMLAYRLMVLTTSGALTALAAAAFYLFALRTTRAPGRSLLATLTVFLGTPLLGWSVNFFGHAAAGALLFLGFFLLSGLSPSAHPLRRAAGAGFLLGVAVVVEYSVAPAAAVIAGYGLWRLRRFGAGQAAGLLLTGALACIVAIVPLLVYHTVSFGDPLSTGYSNVVGFDGMKEGFMGLTRPDPVVIVEIIFGRRRGILWLSPILLAAPWAIWCALRAGWMTAEIITSLLVASFFLLLNASYHYWSGGASMGPRHIVPSMPFVGLAMIRLWALAGGWSFRLLAGLLAVSIVLSIACAATTMTPIGGGFPVLDHAVTRILHGETWFAWYRHVGVAQIPSVLAWVLLAGSPALLIWQRLRRA